MERKGKEGRKQKKGVEGKVKVMETKKRKWNRNRKLGIMDNGQWITGNEQRGREVGEEGNEGVGIGVCVGVEEEC